MHERTTRFGMLLVAALLVAGCGTGVETTFQGPSPDGGGQLSLALAGDYAPGSTWFKIRLYQEAPRSLDAKAYFESPCTPPNPGFNVTDLDVGTGYVVVYDAFSTATCDAATLVARGVRGDVEVTKAGTGNAVYYIQVNEVGAITAFPVPDDSLKDSGVQCESSADCQGTVECPDPNACPFAFKAACEDGEANCINGEKWMQYRVHPKAQCVLGTCRLESLFPLNVQAKRAYQVMAPRTEGDVLMLGGFSQSTGSSLGVGASLSGESFGASSQLFSAADFGSFGGGLGLMGLAMMDGTPQRAVLVGGSPTVGVEVDGNTRLPLPRPMDCAGTCAIQLAGHAWVLDLANGEATRSTLGFATAMALVEPIAGDAGTELFVREGLVQESADRLAAGRSSYRCVVDEGNNLSCVVISGSEQASARFAGSSICLSRGTDLRCTDVVVLGGNTSAAGAFGEIYSKSSGQVKDLVPTTGVPTLAFGATAVVAGGQVWMFGGSTDKKGNSPDVDPVAFNIDPSAGTIRGTSSTLDAASLQLLRRVRHQATPLSDGKTVLITGGLGADGMPLASSVLVEASGGLLTVKSVLNDMAQPRFDHRAVRVLGGLLKDAVLISGGLSGLTGAVQFAEGAEIYLP